MHCPLCAARLQRESQEHCPHCGWPLADPLIKQPIKRKKRSSHSLYWWMGFAFLCIALLSWILMA